MLLLLIAAANIMYLTPATINSTEPDVFYVVRNSEIVQYTLNTSITYRYQANVIKFANNSTLAKVAVDVVVNCDELIS